MTHQELLLKLEQLRRLPHETEWVEFKEANQSFDFRKLGRYFSALSSEANLKNQPCGWLLFGVRDDRSICGSKYRENLADLDSLKHEVANKTGGVTFLDIHVVQHPQGRVVMFQVPPAPQGLPVAYEGHWYGRDG
jgi:ATP-dependent DNA helicase RecG